MSFFWLSVIYDSAVHTFIMCYLYDEFVSSVCYIFPSLAMGSFKLTMIPRSDIPLHFFALPTWQPVITLAILPCLTGSWPTCKPLARGHSHSS